MQKKWLSKGKEESLQKLSLMSQSGESKPQTVVKQSSSGAQTVQWNQYSQPVGPRFYYVALGHLQRNCPKMAKYPFLYVLSSVGSDSVCECKDVCKCRPSSMNSSEELQLTPLELQLRLDLRRCQIHLPRCWMHGPHELDKLSFWNPQLQRC